MVQRIEDLNQYNAALYQLEELQLHRLLSARRQALKRQSLRDVARVPSGSQGDAAHGSAPTANASNHQVLVSTNSRPPMGVMEVPVIVGHGHDVLTQEHAALQTPDLPNVFPWPTQSFGCEAMPAPATPARCEAFGAQHNGAGQLEMVACPGASSPREPVLLSRDDKVSTVAPQRASVDVPVAVKSSLGPPATARSPVSVFAPSRCMQTVTLDHSVLEQQMNDHLQRWGQHRIQLESHLAEAKRLEQERFQQASDVVEACLRTATKPKRQSASFAESQSTHRLSASNFAAPSGDGHGWSGEDPAKRSLSPCSKSNIAKLVADARHAHSCNMQASEWSPLASNSVFNRPSHEGRATAQMVQALRHRPNNYIDGGVFTARGHAQASSQGSPSSPDPPAEQTPLEYASHAAMGCHPSATSSSVFVPMARSAETLSTVTSVGMGAEESVSTSSAAIASEVQELPCLASPAWPTAAGGCPPDASPCEAASGSNLPCPPVRLDPMDQRQHPHTLPPDLSHASLAAPSKASSQMEADFPFDALCEGTSGSPGGSTRSCVAMPGKTVALVPEVYEAALHAIERHGWDAVYPRGDPSGWTVLHWAAAEGRLDICQRLCAARADVGAPDDHGRSALDCACESGSEEVLRLLASVAARSAADLHADAAAVAVTAMGQSWDLCAGASSAVEGPCVVPAARALESVLNASLQPPSLVTDIQASPGVNGSLASPATAPPNTAEGCDSPLLQAVPAVYAAAISAIERHGWRALHGGDPEWTALHWAAAERRATICERLMRCGADANQIDCRGWSALDYARESGDEATLRSLLIPPSCRGSGASTLVELATPPTDVRVVPLVDASSGAVAAGPRVGTCCELPGRSPCSGALSIRPLAH